MSNYSILENNLVLVLRFQHFQDGAVVNEDKSTHALKLSRDCLLLFLKSGSYHSVGWGNVVNWRLA